MNAASLQMAPGHVPVAAAPVAPLSVSGGGGITPAAGQGFVPAAGAAAASAPEGAQGAKQEATAEQLLQVITQALAKTHGAPIIGADGTVYMEKQRPNVVNGALQLSFLVVGKLDKATGKFTPSPEVVQLIQAKQKEAEGAGSATVLVKIGEQMVWQTITKDEQGKPVVADMRVATEQEIAQHQQDQAQQQAKQAAQASLQNRGDWQQKVGVVAQNLGLFGSAGQLVSGLSSGPDPYSGKPGAGWITGWILAQRLNSKSEGKLLPGFLQQGPVATAVEFGIQAWGMLDMGKDIRTLGDYFAKRPPAPIADVAGGTARLLAQGTPFPVADALAKAGAQLRIGERAQQMGQTGGLQMVARGANQAVLNSELGAVQLLTKADAHRAYAAVNPVQDAGLKLRDNIDDGITKGLGVLKGLVQPAMIGATALGLVSSVINVRNVVDQAGAKALIDTKSGRGAILGATTSAAFLGMYVLPMILPGLGVAAPAIAAVSAGVNLAQNVLGGVQLLNTHGLFGGEGGKKAGFMDNDGFRAAFLIPPLTPIGAFAFWMKHKKKREAEEAAKLDAAKKIAMEKIQQQREMAKLQLQSTGQIAGAAQGENGSIVVPTGVPLEPARMLAMLQTGTAGGVAPAAPAPAPAPAAAAAAPASAAPAPSK